MTDKELKLAIQQAIINFSKAPVYQASIGLFQKLGYNTERQNPLPHKSYDDFKDSFLGTDSPFNEEKACVKEWKSIDLLFQLTADEVSRQSSLFNTKQVDNTIIETYLFFSIELSKAEYNRTQLAQITREINKVFPMPVLIVFKHGESITLSVINRRLNKKDAQKDVLEKVTVIKDIFTTSPHRAHIEILFDLSFSELQRVHKFTNFVELHNAWQKTLDTKELNKRFYRDLSNWYFWALQEVQFPTTNWAADKNSLLKEEEKVKEHNAKNLIRLLTRLLFVWFVKEKNLVPDELFDESYIKDNLLNGFEPRKKKGFDHKTLGSKYYRAILQNLFFATLNQTAGKREFRKDGQQMNVTNLMRYESYFKDPKNFIKLVEEIVPFMNGGLFECLDSPDPVLKGKKGGDVIIYEDGFSDRSDNTLCVPDYIFFGTSEHADLSVELGDKKQKDVTVNGLINILKSYKFTVTENTPIEEDIALDPELLGRVFENLLASYNPETKTTARKQTGSFYTPREIVNYMVDESLKAYLKQKLESEAGMKPEDAEVGLDFLVGYNEKTHLFDDKQTSVLINAIDNCKILDPACGSGAFPMGILHKLVHILHKLDPNNKLWKERQIEKAQAIDDSEIRDKLIEDIETSFESNELDYGRKLYLIENCIYGVDIQPIATQISKLRFFISLIVDQKTDKSKHNFGIRPLPNLETKFVAANTLIGIEKPKQQASLFDNPKVQALEIKLKDIRHRLFSAKTPATKRKLREEDQRLREEMGALLVQSGWGNESAHQLSAWDPYNQNVSSGWFDPEWMFGIEEGFDIVIGNPPYDVYQGYRNDELELVKNLAIYPIAQGGKLNAYKLFLAKSSSLMNNNGFVCQIFQNSFLGDLSAKNTRIHYLTNHTVHFIASFPERDDTNKRVFPGVKMSTCIMLAGAASKGRSSFILNVYKDRDFTLKSSITYQYNEIKAIDPEYYTILSIDETEKQILIHISNNTRLKEFGKCYEGEINLTFHKKYLSLIQKNGYAKMIKGAAVQKYFTAKKMSQGDEEYLDKIKYLKENKGKKSKHNENERIVLQGITGVDESHRLKMTILPSGVFCGNSVNYILLNDNKLSNKYLLAILNSSLLNWYYKKFSTNSNVNGYEVDSLPIPRISEPEQKPFIDLVDKILAGKEQSKDTSTLEKQIDQLVYKLYDLTKEEIAIIEGSVK